MILTVIICSAGFLAMISILFLVFWKVWFLRDPEREIPQGNSIVSPADGKVIQVTDLDNVDELKIKKGLIGKIKTLCSEVDKSCYLVSIFMNLSNVHVQRASISGKVISVNHSKGKFIIVNSIKAGLQNEKSEILINTKIGKIKIIQIAGFVARRIETWVKPGQDIIKGEKIGRINLGSQVTIVIPKKVKIKVKKGDSVKAGTSILAEY